MKRVLPLLLAVTLLVASLVGCAREEIANVTPGVTATGNSAGTGEEAAGAGSAEPTGPADYSSAQAVTLSGSSSVNITSGGYYTLSGQLTNGQVLVNTKEQVHLELAGVTISNNRGPAIQIENAKSITLTIKAGTKNSLSDGGNSQYNAVVFSNDTLVLEGEGQLQITGNVANGVESDDDIIINGGVITVKAENKGFTANDLVTVNGGALDITAVDEGMESKGDLVINGGSIQVAAGDDGINAGTNLTINGGSVYSESARNDGIDSNGPIKITAGTVVAIGATAPEEGIDCDNNTLSITGGTIVGIGGVNSTPTASACTQPVVVLSGTSANTWLHIAGSSSTLLNFLASRSYQSLLFSSPQLVKGQSYSVSTGGSVSGGTSFHGLSSGGTYSGGSQSTTFTTSDIVTILGGTNGGFGGGPGGGRMGGGQPPTLGGK